MKLVTTKFKSGGLYEKHVVAIWNLGKHLSICGREFHIFLVYVHMYLETHSCLRVKWQSMASLASNYAILCGYVALRIAHSSRYRVIRAELRFRPLRRKRDGHYLDITRVSTAITLQNHF